MIYSNSGYELTSQEGTPLHLFNSPTSDLLILQTETGSFLQVPSFLDHSLDQVQTMDFDAYQIQANQSLPLSQNALEGPITWICLDTTSQHYELTIGEHTSHWYLQYPRVMVESLLSSLDYKKFKKDYPNITDKTPTLAKVQQKYPLLLQHFDARVDAWDWPLSIVLAIPNRKDHDEKDGSLTCLTHYQEFSPYIHSLSITNLGFYSPLFLLYSYEQFETLDWIFQEHPEWVDCEFELKIAAFHQNCVTLFDNDKTYDEEQLDKQCATQYASYIEQKMLELTPTISSASLNTTKARL